MKEFKCYNNIIKYYFPKYWEKLKKEEAAAEKMQKNSTHSMKVNRLFGRE